MRKAGRFAMLIAILTGLVALTPAANAGGVAPIDVPDSTFTDVNPCTGDPITITVHYDHAVFGEWTDRAGGAHVTFSGTGTFTSADGYRGGFTSKVVFETTAEGTFAHTYTNSSTMRNGTGVVLLALLRGHVTIVEGTPVVGYDSVSIRCVGAP
jgi:hypothetical protein